jgi:hypothetical protein
MSKISNEKIVRRIKTIRTKNNRIWMKLLVLAFQNNPQKAKQITRQIVQYDKSVVKWMSRLH